MLEVLVGMIASGKSTYAAKRAQEGAVIVNDDAIVTSLHGGDYGLYNKNLKPLYKSIESHIIYAALLKNIDIVVDRVNYNRSMRSRYISIGKSCDAYVKIIVFPNLGLDTHVNRRMSNPRGHTKDHWIEAYTRHYDLYEEPWLEGDEIVFFTT